MMVYIVEHRPCGIENGFFESVHANEQSAVTRREFLMHLGISENDVVIRRTELHDDGE